MPQLTKQDVAEVVEEVFDRKFDEKFDQKFDEKFDQKFDQKMGLKPGQTFDEKLDEKLDKKLGLQSGETLDNKLGAFVEHIGDKFDSLAEAVSLMSSNMKTLARQSDLDEVKNDVKTIKLAVRETNRDLRHLEDNI